MQGQELMDWGIGDGRNRPKSTRPVLGRETTGPMAIEGEWHDLTPELQDMRHRSRIATRDSGNGWSPLLASQLRGERRDARSGLQGHAQRGTDRGAALSAGSTR